MNQHIRLSAGLLNWLLILWQMDGIKYGTFPKEWIRNIKQHSLIDVGSQRLFPDSEKGLTANSEKQTSK